MPSILYIRRAEKFVLFIKRHEEETKLEIERKFLIKRENLPENLEQYPSKVIEQGYLCTEPVVRIRKSNDNYYLTYKSKGLLAREEYNLPLTKEAYEHLKPKADGIVISKVRYVIPEKDGLSIELDVFSPLRRSSPGRSGIPHRRSRPRLPAAKVVRGGCDVFHRVSQQYLK